MIKDKNFSFKTLVDLHDEIIEECNLTQEEPHTNPFQRCSNLTIRSCNLKNCDWPDDFIIEDCFVGHFTKEIKETEIEIKAPDGTKTTEIVEEIIETKID